MEKFLKILKKVVDTTLKVFFIILAILQLYVFACGMFLAEDGLYWQGALVACAGIALMYLFGYVSSKF